MSCYPYRWEREQTNRWSGKEGVTTTKSSTRNARITFIACTHLETHRQHSLPPNISPLSKSAQFSAMSWQRASQSFVCKSCTGIAGGDLISAPSPGVSCWISYLQVWEILKCINNMDISWWYESSKTMNYTGVCPDGIQTTLHFINYLQTQL